LSHQFGTSRTAYERVHRRAAPVGSDVMEEYSVQVEEQAGAGGLLTDVGALAEIEQAVIAHCVDHAPQPPYKPEEIKNRLEPAGWLREVRVPPFDPQYDALPINERYDLWKVFDAERGRVGVAIEIERWEVWTDLLKFRRGIQRGQIVAGVILHDNPQTLSYVFNHLRHLSEPLFGEMPVAIIAPTGPGLADATTAKARSFSPFRMPDDHQP
jgi:hypothetical protein